jgi:putative pyrroloquinoline-quinone binding quinoprotein
MDLSAAPDPRAVGVACCDIVNRGAVFADGKIIYNTLDAHTVAVDASSGKQVWKTRVGNVGETLTQAPLVVKGKVIVGNSGGELGVRGWVLALAVSDGRELWRAHNTGPDEDVKIGPDFKPYYAKDQGKDLARIEWQRFFEVDGLPGVKNLRKLIDTKISQGLFELPIPGAASSGSNVLAFHNMVRGKQYGIPSGQAVAEAMGEPIFTPADLNLGPGFENGTPLWFYILAESERRQGGLQLRNVGARIVAEVFLTNLKRDKGSYLKAEPAFQPSVPHQGDFTIGDFLQFAGVVQSSGSE